MRAIAILVALGACGGNGDGIEEAKRQAALQDKDKGESAKPAAKVTPPVPSGVHLKCDQVIDAAAFGKALNEVEAMTIRDNTANEAEAAASCSLVRGGKRPNEAEQKAIAKAKGRIGVIPGDDTCNITLKCWTFEDENRLRARCKERKWRDDDTMGNYACVQVVATGEDDVNFFRFVDPDTKCLFEIRGGPGMTDNDYIRTCAKTARDSIGPTQIAVKP